MKHAPLHADLADAPDGGAAHWLHATDGVRLRLAHWPHESGRDAIIFPGRTEVIEKYGRVVAALARRGYGCFVVDWRGQGLSDRLAEDPKMGHVDRFSDYQLDVAAVLAAVREIRGDAPLHVLAHSMGGCIALRALTSGLAAAATAFSAPMWGIALTPGLRRGMRVLSAAGRMTGLDARYIPGAGREFDLSEMSFDDNTLTTDREAFEWMRHQVRSHPELALGAPSLRWLGAALAECRELASLPPPDVPAYCALGSREKVVCPDAVRIRMEGWPGGELENYDGAEHEIMMEQERHRSRFIARVADLFDRSRTPALA